MATAATDDRPLGREDAGLADLRREALRLMLAVVGCLAFVQLFAAGALIGGLEERPAYPALALALLVAACYGLVGRSVRLASAVLVVGLVAVIGLCLML